MAQSNSIKLFEDRNIRTIWDDQEEKWYFSVVDIVSVLTNSIDPGAYWRKLKQRLKEEGNETVTNCHGLKANMKVARIGGDAAGRARKEIEKSTGKKVVSKKNARNLKLISE